MKTIIVLILSLTAVYSAQARYEYEDDSYDLVNVISYGFKKGFEQLGETAVKVKSEIKQFGSILIKRLIAQGDETKEGLSQVAENVNELSRKFEKFQQTILKRLNESEAFFPNAIRQQKIE